MKSPRRRVPRDWAARDEGEEALLRRPARPLREELKYAMRVASLGRSMTAFQLHLGSVSPAGRLRAWARRNRATSQEVRARRPQSAGVGRLAAGEYAAEFAAPADPGQPRYLADSVVASCCPASSAARIAFHQSPGGPTRGVGRLAVGIALQFDHLRERGGELVVGEPRAAVPRIRSGGGAVASRTGRSDLTTSSRPVHERRRVPPGASVIGVDAQHLLDRRRRAVRHLGAAPSEHADQRPRRASSTDRFG